MLHMLYSGSFKVLTPLLGSLVLGSELLVALTPGAALPAAALLFLEIPHLPAL